MHDSLRPSVDDELTDDVLTGRFRVWQRRRGHRYSLDDVCVAYVAARTRPNARSYVDLGCGLGSVLLMVTDKLDPTRVAGIEAQPISAALARRNLARNGVAERVRLIEGDLRDPNARARLGARFELVTGTPPYLPAGSASLSPDPQRAHARVELRGGIEAYLAATAELLEPHGRFVVCCDARRPDRALGGARAAGLFAHRKLDVIPRAGRKGALFTVWTFAAEPAELVEEEPFVARDENGARTEAAHSIRRYFGVEPNLDEGPSP